MARPGSVSEGDGIKVSNPRIEVRKKLWDNERTLYHHRNIEALESATKDALETEGHMSPDRVPPHDVAEWVRDGT